MDVLIAKLGASGDVIRTTSLLARLPGSITWLTEAKNKALLEGLPVDLRCFSWDEKESCRDKPYDLTINLEDTPEVAEFVGSLTRQKMWGAQLDANGRLTYTPDSRDWFDLGVISQHGRGRADQLKLANRATYQELIFSGLGLQFSGERYFLPDTPRSPLQGDVAIASEAGPVWPMKKWSYYKELAECLQGEGIAVNFLPPRPSILQHLADVRGHRCLLSGDSLPMHFALGSGIRCVSLFTCTSPWEIYDYGLQEKIVSPLLTEYFYQRGYEARATTAISLEEVYQAVKDQLGRAALRRPEPASQSGN